MIRLIALDLDGTTLCSDGSVSAVNRSAIRAAEDAGVLITIATGRRFRDAQPVGADLGLNAPLITHNGALLKYADSGAIVHSSVLSSDTAHEVIIKGKSLGGGALVSVDPFGIGTMLYDRISEDNLPLKKYLRWAEGLHGIEIGRKGVEHVSDLGSAVSEHTVVHISFSGTCHAMESLQHSLTAELSARVTMLATIYPALDLTLLDILPPESSKGHGVATLAEINNIPRENVMCIGDNFNDLEMLEYAGVGVVMGNADKKLLDRPEFYTTLTNNDNGVAAAIDRFVFNKEKS